MAEADVAWHVVEYHLPISAECVRGGLEALFAGMYCEVIHAVLGDGRRVGFGFLGNPCLDSGADSLFEGRVRLVLRVEREDFAVRGVHFVPVGVDFQGDERAVGKLVEVDIYGVLLCHFVKFLFQKFKFLPAWA